MKIKEAAQAVGCTSRAIKFYEDKGLLPAVTRSANGYRDYTDRDIRRLHEIQVYRKLGIGLEDIRRLLSSNDQTALSAILEKKRSELADRQKELAALEAYIRCPDPQALDEAIDFSSIAAAIRAQLPGFFGEYCASHFAPHLTHRITTEEQREAYAAILAFWDQPKLRLPLGFYLSTLFMRVMPKVGVSAEQAAANVDARIASMLSPSEEVYARIKAQTLKTVRLRENPFVRYSLPEWIKRRMMRRLQDCGYNDIFIPAMKRLSPSYRAYHDALDALNDRLCRDLGLYYDSAFHLRLKK